MKKKIAIIDDNELTLCMWELAFSEFILIFKTPEEFIARAEKKIDQKYQIVAIVTDFYFSDRISKFDGYTFALHEKNIGNSIPIFLSTNMNLNTEKKAIFQGAFNKDITVIWQSIEKYLLF